MNSQQKLQRAMEYAMVNRPSVGGFPFFAECLRRAGVVRNEWSLPAVQSIYVMEEESLVHQGTSLVTGMALVPHFNQDALLSAIRADQSGQSTFPEFLDAAWRAGVVQYTVDFVQRTVTYRGVAGETYTEEYGAVDVPGLTFAE